MEMRKKANKMQYWSSLSATVQIDVTYDDEGTIRKGKIAISIEEITGPGIWQIDLKDLPVTRNSTEMQKIGPLIGRKLSRYNAREVAGVVTFVKRQIIAMQDLPKVRKKKT